MQNKIGLSEAGGLNLFGTLLRILLGILFGTLLGILLGLPPQAAAALTEDPNPAVFAFVDNESDPTKEQTVAPTRTNAVAGVDQAITDSVVRIYLAVLNRQPDEVGLEYWVDLYRDGTSLLDVVGSFIASQEWTSRYGQVDDIDFVVLLYNNVLSRSPDVEGLHYWVDQLTVGLTRTELVTYFSESAEFVAKTGTTEPLPPYPAVPSNSGIGRRIVYSGAAQRVWLVNDDETVADSYLVSGRRGTPNTGSYQVYSKSGRAWAGHDGITMDHMVRFTRGRSLAIGFHSIPKYRDGTPMQTLDQLGTYQSAGCIRQEAEKAKLLFDWAVIGTTVTVVD